MNEWMNETRGTTQPSYKVRAMISFMISSLPP